MKVNLLTDALGHNLALMKLSTYHKALGNTVTLNDPEADCDYSYGSWLYTEAWPTDLYGGPGVDPSILSVRLKDIEDLCPDYELYGLDFSLGHTWEYCPRKCAFCVVPRQNNPKVHHSIWDFHDSRFGKICLLNNNTFSDPQWRDTFEEIWDARLTVIENGFDVRLLTDEKAVALKCTKFEKQIHFAWDFMEDEVAVVRGLELARKYQIRAMVYVLIGYNTTREEDLHRCQIIHNLHFDPYPMPYNFGTRADRAFKRFICLRAYRPYTSLMAAWDKYERKNIT